MTNKIPGRHPNQDKWDRQRADADAAAGSIEQKRTNLRLTQARISRTTDASERRSLEIKAEAQAAALDRTTRGRSR